VMTAITIAIVLAYLHVNGIDRVLEQCYRSAYFSVTSRLLVLHVERNVHMRVAGVCQCNGGLVSCELSKLIIA
jgi:hypothetical protein